MSAPSIMLLIWLGFIVFALGVPSAVGYRVARRDRRRMMADGASAQGLITKINPPSKSDRSKVYFSFQPTSAKKPVEGSQVTAHAATERLGLMVGSSVQVQYLPKSARWGFIPALAYAERCLAVSASFNGPDEPLGIRPPLFYVSYGNPTANGFRWMGGGDVMVTDRAVRFWAYRRRILWFPRIDQREFALTRILDVEHHDKAIRLAASDDDGDRRVVQLQMVSVADAEALAQLLPDTKTEKYVPALAEGAEFLGALSRLTPKPYVTPALIGTNAIMFVVIVAFGGGFFVPNSEAMIKFGTDYTPLTLAGQWWRLLTSTFLHFGLMHLAFNMFALYVNGRMAERIYGSVRYLVIYLVGGLTGSLASLLWHPLVNGAGASGAIFGVLGALLAFFVKKERGVPASVIKAQRYSAAVFIAYNLLNGARVQGIDNAAHLGGLVAGFVMGYLLSRPLTPDRDQHSWTRQWVATLGLCGSATLLIVFMLSNGTLAPRQARDSDGNPIPLAGLSPAVRSLGGFQLGMTPDEVHKLKGAPLTRENLVWLYNAIDDRHDAVISVHFLKGPDGVPGKIYLIDFTGHDSDSAPRDVPYLNSLTTEDVIQKYGGPLKKQILNNGWGELLFRNGIYIRTQNDKVFSYGVFDLSLLRT
jgi:membrane associated rhomboid family serine protease